MQGGVNRGLGRLEGGGGCLLLPMSPERVFFPPLGAGKERAGFSFIIGNKKNNRLEKGVSGKHCHEMTLAPSSSFSPGGEVRTEVYELNIDFFSCSTLHFFFFG